MVLTDYNQFEKLVNDGISLIPEEFKEKLDNVAFFIEDYPNKIQKRKVNLRGGWTLFGLYEGVPLTKRNSYYSNVMPDKITLFKKPLEYYAQNEEHLKRMVSNTVWHEIAHHFGLNEKEVRDAEKRRGHQY